MARPCASVLDTSVLPAEMQPLNVVQYLPSKPITVWEIYRIREKVSCADEINDCKFDLVKQMLRSGNTFCNELSFYPIIDACESGDHKTLDKFLSAGLDAEILRINRNAALRAACDHGQLEVVKKLVKVLTLGDIKSINLKYLKADPKNLLKREGYLISESRVKPRRDVAKYLEDLIADAQ